MPGLQLEQPENITTRNEVTRWFRVAILDLLYVANMLTSGNENNAGLGIIPFPDSVWICENTLRETSPYVSIRLCRFDVHFLHCHWYRAIVLCLSSRPISFDKERWSK